MGHRERDISTELIEAVTGRETSRHFGEVEFTSTESESEAETFHKKERVAYAGPETCGAFETPMHAFGWTSHRMQAFPPSVTHVRETWWMSRLRLSMSSFWLGCLGY